MMGASVRLIERLERRRERVEPEERAALAREIEELSSSVLYSLGSNPDAKPPVTAGSIAALSSSIARERLYLGAIMILATLVMIFIAAWLSAGVGSGSVDEGRDLAEPARLVVESRPADALLRIRRPEDDELLVKIPGAGAKVELDAGHYEIEVAREDCPDSWTQQIDLEPGETRRYEPTLCVGAGELVVRSNVSGDRLRIDDLDLGATRSAPHLLGVGDHRVRVEKEGFEPFEGQVRIRPDEKIELRAELVASSPGAKSENGAGKGADAAGAQLPFEVVAPSAPPGNARSRANQAPGGVRKALLPEPMAPDRIRPEELAMPDPIHDFDSDVGGPRLPKGGSTTWHDAVSTRIVSRFDADGSGRIDRVSETESIPCGFWKEIERSFDQGRLGLSMSRLYGFDGSEWHPRALGFSRDQRGLAYERMKDCGLEP
jgi:PEGA domain